MHKICYQRHILGVCRRFVGKELNDTDKLLCIVVAIIYSQAAVFTTSRYLLHHFFVICSNVLRSETWGSSSRQIASPLGTEHNIIFFETFNLLSEQNCRVLHVQRTQLSSFALQSLTGNLRKQLHFMGSFTFVVVVSSRSARALMYALEIFISNNLSASKSTSYHIFLRFHFFETCSRLSANSFTTVRALPDIPSSFGLLTGSASAAGRGKPSLRQTTSLGVLSSPD